MARVGFVVFFYERDYLPPEFATLVCLFSFVNPIRCTEGSKYYYHLYNYWYRHDQS